MRDAQSFRAVLEHGDRSLGWTVAHLPFDPKAVWPAMVRLRVCGVMQGPVGEVSFRTSLFPHAAEHGRSGFYLLVNRAMQQGSGTVLGMEAEFRVEPDLQERPAELPEELDALLDEAEGLRAWYGSMTEYTRREIGKWIGGVKGEESRLRRAEQMAERLLSTMEAEVELPPMVERAFRARPKARLGWERMTSTQRRGELFAVFYYRTPESQEKRLTKLVEAAEKRAG